MKKLVFWSLVVLAFPTRLQAAQLECALNLAPLPDTYSSEIKTLDFTVSLLQDHSPTNGSLTTDSCWGTIVEAYSSTTAQVKIMTMGDSINGDFQDINFKISEYHYSLILKFAQMAKSPDDTNPINIFATGKITSSDHPNFIHEVASGECVYSPL